MFRPTNLTRRPYRRIRIKRRALAIPIYCDRPAVKQLANRVTDVVEPVLGDNVHGWRRGHSVTTAVAHIAALTGQRMSFDIEHYFDSIDQQHLRRQLDRIDPSLWPRLEPWLPDEGLPTGFAFSPALGNLYLSDVDVRFPMVRFADNIMIVDPHPMRVFRRLERHLSDIGLRCHQVDPAPTHFCKTLLRPLGQGVGAR